MNERLRKLAEELTKANDTDTASDITECNTYFNAYIVPTAAELIKLQDQVEDLRGEVQGLRERIIRLETSSTGAQVTAIRERVEAFEAGVSQQAPGLSIDDVLNLIEAIKKP